MKVSELARPLLDYWVAKAEGLEARMGVDMDGYRKPCCGVLRTPEHPDALPWWCIYRPSDNWEQGGPIIERELDTVINNGADGIWCHGPGWYKCQLKKHGYVAEGRTILEAAMRCYVASRFGEEVPES